MAKTTLLLADNNPDYLESTASELEKAGFKVIRARTPDETRRALLQKRIDLALLDMRLTNDEDDTDTSGLEIAKTVAPLVPKVIVSEWGSFEDARTALGRKADGLSAAVGFVKKREGLQALLTAIHEILYFKQGVDDLALLLVGYYGDARTEARQYYLVSLIASIIGIFIILAAGVLGFLGNAAPAIATALAGLIIQATSYLAFRRSDKANDRRDSYHSELLRLRHLDILLAACSSLLANDQQRCRKQVIAAATGSWFPVTVVKQEPRPIDTDANEREGGR
jgi:CheY-like chemotaxis protein